MKCSKCHSKHLIGWGKAVKKGSKKVRRYQCQNCGHVGVV